MQDTGVVRRIDELGRVVVPKEMRKTLRIREGDPLEIFTDKESLIFKKYSPIKSLDNLSKVICEGINIVSKKDCIVTDNDSIVFVTGSKNKGLLNMKISYALYEVMKERKQLLLSKNKGDKIISIIKDDFFDIEHQLIIPIVSNGDCFGSIILFSTDRDLPILEVDKSLMQLGAIYLSKQFDS